MAAATDKTPAPDKGDMVYNSTDGALPIDADGHVLGARESLEDVDTSVEPIKGHLKAGRMVVVGGPTKRTVHEEG